MRRLWHWLNGHEWHTESAVYCSLPNLKFSGGPPKSKADLMAIHGLTVVYETCACGLSRYEHLVGDHSGITGKAELRALERMSSLDRPE